MEFWNCSGVPFSIMLQRKPCGCKATSCLLLLSFCLPGHDRLHPWTTSQNKLFFSLVALAFLSTGAEKELRQPTRSQAEITAKCMSNEDRHKAWREQMERKERCQAEQKTQAPPPTSTQSHPRYRTSRGKNLSKGWGEKYQMSSDIHFYWCASWNGSEYSR